MKSEKSCFGLYGAGGCARGVMPFVKSSLTNQGVPGDWDDNSKIFFVETNPTSASINGHKLLSEGEFVNLAVELKYFNIGVADSKLRESLALKCLNFGAVPMSIYSPNSIQYEENKIGKGAIICANTMITSNVEIGRFFHLNIYSYVEHDCVIGDFVTFAPGVKCNGNVRIESHAYIGAGAVIKQGRSGRPLIIGQGAVVGMGAVVVDDVPPYATVIGVPARPVTNHKK